MQSRNSSLDFFRLFSAWLVVSLHTVDILKIIPSYMIFIESIGRIAVPFFFTLTGYMLEEKKAFEKSTTYLPTYLYNILKQFFIWCSLYLFFLNLLQIAKRYILKEPANIILPSKFLFYYGYGVYWYLVAIVWAILIYKILVKNMKKNYIYILSVVLLCISLFGKGQVFSSEILNFQTRDGLFMGFPYLVLGINLSLKKERLKKVAISNKILFSISFICLFLTYKHLKYIYENVQLNKPTDILPFVYLVITIIFILCIKNPDSLNFKFIQINSKYSAGVFFTHMFFIKISLFIDKKINFIELIEKNIIFGLVYISGIFLISLYMYTLLIKLLSRYINKFHTLKDQKRLKI